MAAEDLYATIPDPPMGPEDLGVGPLPAPPQPPQPRPVTELPVRPPVGRAQSLAAILSALVLGPQRGGTGALVGLNRTQDQAHEDQFKQQAFVERQAAQQQQYDEREFALKQVAYERERQRQEQTIQQKGLALKSALNFMVPVSL